MTHDRRTPRPRADHGEEPARIPGQGEGEQEPTIPEDDAESSTTPTWTEGAATELGEPETLTREDEGMDR